MLDPEEIINLAMTELEGKLPKGFHRLSFGAQ